MSTGSTTPPAARYFGPPSPWTLAERLGIPLDQICKLDANESPYGPPPSAVAALARFASHAATLSGAGRYPDPVGRELRAALAAYTGAEPESIVIGNGSDEIIALLAELVIQPGDEVVVAEPTFGVYGLVADRRGASVVDAGREPDFTLAAQRIIDASTERTRVIFLCSPNNPTGTPLSRETLLAILRETARADGISPLVVMDEAYYEFGAFSGAPDAWSAAPLVAQFGRLVVLRTFSKLFGLAGLRIGYAICPPELATRLRERKQPYNVNVAGLLAARASLNDVDWLSERAQAIVAERDRLAQGLGAFPALRVYPSSANFLLVETLDALAEPLWSALQERGIMLRRFSGPRMARYLRVTVGTPLENTRLLDALTGIYGASSREGDDHE